MGHLFSCNARDLVDKDLRLCYNLRRMPAKKNIEWCRELAAKKGGECLSEEYVNSHTKYKWGCSGRHQWEATASDIRHGYWCPHCAGLAPHSLLWCQGLATKRGGRCLSVEYKNALTKYLWECDKCHKWEAKANDIQQGKWCPYCAGKAAHDLLWLKKIATQRGGMCLSTEYKNTKIKYKWRCDQGHEWEAKANDVHQGHWCPACFHRHSVPELEVFNFVRTRYIDAISGQGQLLKNKALELDVYIPSLKKAIEFDGHRWHKSEWALNKGQAERDARKDQQCLEAGIELLRIDEADWKADKEAVLVKIKSWLSGQPNGSFQSPPLG